MLRKSLANLLWPGRRRSAPHLRLGARGERAAARFLRRRGWRVVQRDYDSPLGQIDLICLDRDTLVFVEVKTRTPADVTAEILVKQGQWQRIEAAARHYVSRNKVQDSPRRIDLVVVTFIPWRRACVEHFIDARMARQV